MNGKVLEKISEYENIIRQIKDVVSARIVTNDIGDILEVHVLANQNRGPKQLVRDIESAIMAQYGVAIDHKKVSVAQLQHESVDEHIHEFRPQLVNVELNINGITAEAKVELRIGHVVIAGKIAGPSATNNRLRLIVTATLSSLEQYLKGNCTFAVEDVMLVNLGRQEAAVVSISLVTLIGEEYLIGSSFVKGDEYESIVKATLNAINRRLSILAKE